MDSDKEKKFDPADFIFATAFTYRKRKVFVSAKVNAILCAAMKFHVEEGNVDIAGYVIMPEHVHIILRPGKMAAHQFVNNFKSYTGIKVKEAGGFSGKVWRQRFYDLEIENMGDFAERLELMHNSPVKKNYVKQPEDYQWSSYRAYHGGGSVVPVFLAPVL